MKLDIGDRVVYRSYGIGRVAARRTHSFSGEEQDVVVLELTELTVSLPLELARKRLRPLATGAELERVGDALRARIELAPGTWLSRRRGTLTKLFGGTPVQLAEIVTEGAQRAHLRSVHGGKAQLSLDERAIVNRARSLLSEEVAQALDVEPIAAERWIERHLTRTD